MSYFALWRSFSLVLEKARVSDLERVSAWPSPNLYVLTRNQLFASSIPLIRLFEFVSFILLDRLLGEITLLWTANPSTSIATPLPPMCAVRDAWPLWPQHTRNQLTAFSRLRWFVAKQLIPAALLHIWGSWTVHCPLSEHHKRTLHTRRFSGTIKHRETAGRCLRTVTLLLFHELFISSFYL